MRRQVVELGPPIELVPVSHFTRARLTEAQLADLWSVTGPTVARNLGRVPLWQVIAMAYYEGLEHGASANMESEDERTMGTDGLSPPR